MKREDVQQPDRGARSDDLVPSDAVADRVGTERLGKRGRRTLHVDWYGGESFMSLDFLESDLRSFRCFV
jgi:hypothetical protein